MMNPPISTKELTRYLMDSLVIDMRYPLEQQPM
jgi:hypothetical protein